MSAKTRNILIIVGVIVVIGLIIFSSLGSTYDKAVALDETVKSQWANVESAYQRRADLIPNLVNTVKGYADFEQETLTQVIEARAKATSVNISPENLNAESIQQFQQAQQGLSSALSRLLVVVEKYPDLKANQNFLELQAQLEGTENRINVERNRYNDSVRQYNTYIRGFYRRLILGLTGGDFERKSPFEAREGSDVAPTVNF
ncbi:MAG: LemA family protein [Bacteroidales bacterium]|nr:LemA family protein [Bacteroidales bacterium]